MTAGDRHPAPPSGCATRALAAEMLWIFKAQGIDREALAALRVFREATEREAATAELARRVGDFPPGH